MSVSRNREFFPIANSKTVTVSLTFIVDAGADDSVVLRNAAEAAKNMADYREFQSWVKSIEIKKG